MELRTKAPLILFALLFSGQSLALTSEYVSAFKPAESKARKSAAGRSLLELQKDIREDIFQLRSMMSFPEKKIIGFMKEREKPVSALRSPADI